MKWVARGDKREVGKVFHTWKLFSSSPIPFWSGSGTVGAPRLKVSYRLPYRVLESEALAMHGR